MEKIFVDTSALFALINMDDENYDLALSALAEMIERNAILITNNYLIVECFTLLQRRLGLDAVRELSARIIPLLQIEWIEKDQHTVIVEFVFSANRRHLSLVDCSSFETMKRLGVRQAFTFDSHFAEQGFDIIP